ncbi:MAG TPA: hypothetical protein VIH53_00830 [Gemmatimonadaceae bacterium]
MRSLLVALALAAYAHQQPPSIDVHSEDPAVYRAVLDSIFIAHNSDRVHQLVILDSTSSFRRENLVPGGFRDLFELQEVDSTAVHNFEIRNLEAHSLKYLATVALPVPVTLVTHESLRSLPRENPDKYWTEFYKRYPRAGGEIRLYGIGYSANGNIALLMVDHSCGSLCGGGYNVVAKRLGGRWRVIVVQQTWVS